ncbi:MAG: LysR substrate-binding domain-containing protein [Burkholderiales bacterium]
MNLLEALRYLAALDQHRHFGRAALACHITQPALSNALRALEAELGVALVRRSRQYEGLTTEGEVVLAHAHRLLHGSEALRQDLAGLAGAPRGRLQLGAVPSAMPVAAQFAARLRARHPGIRPVLRALSSQALESGLESLALDLALGYTGRPEVAARGLRVWPQYTERYFLLQRVPAKKKQAPALQVGPPLAWREVAGRALVMLTPEMHHRTIVDQALREAGVELEPAMETDSVLALLQAVQESSAGDGADTLAVVLPGALVGVVREHSGLLARPLRAPEVQTPIGFMTGAGSQSGILAAALVLAQDAEWQAHMETHAGALGHKQDRLVRPGTKARKTPLS